MVLTGHATKLLSSSLSISASASHSSIRISSLITQTNLHLASLIPIIQALLTHIFSGGISIEMFSYSSFKYSNKSFTPLSLLEPSSTTIISCSTQTFFWISSIICLMNLVLLYTGITILSTSQEYISYFTVVYSFREMICLPITVVSHRIW